MHTSAFDRLAIVAAWAALASCDPTKPESPSCGPVDISIDVVAAPLASDGSAVVTGRVRLAPVASGTEPTATSTGAAGGASTAGGDSEEDGAQTERTIHDLYVGSTRVTRTEFNFRAFTVAITRDQLCSYLAGDTAVSSLPVRAYLAGDGQTCVYDDAGRISVPLGVGHCDGGGGSGGTGAGGGGGAAGTGSSTAEGASTTSGGGSGGGL